MLEESKAVLFLIETNQVSSQFFPIITNRNDMIITKNRLDIASILIKYFIYFDQMSKEDLIIIFQL